MYAFDLFMVWKGPYGIGMVLFPFAFGASHICLDVSNLSADYVFDLIRDQKPTILAATPRTIKMLIESDRASPEALSSLRLIYCCVLMCWYVDVLMSWCVDVLMCWWVDVLMCWCVDVLMCWCVGVLMCWWADVLMCWCVDVLMCWCVDVLMCWWADVLMCWCVDVLMCWCVDVLMTVLMCWVSMCWCVDVLMCWCVDVLMCVVVDENTINFPAVWAHQLQKYLNHWREVLQTTLMSVVEYCAGQCRFNVS